MEGALAAQSTNEWLGEALNQFSSIDQDGDGTITMEELIGTAPRAWDRPTYTELQNMLNEGDADHDGTLDPSEFVFGLSLLLQKRQAGDPGWWFATGLCLVCLPLGKKAARWLCSP